MNTYISSLTAHSLTRGTRILFNRDEDGLLALAGNPSVDYVGIVDKIRITGTRMRVFLWGGREVYCGKNDKAVVIL